MKCGRLDLCKEQSPNKLIGQGSRTDYQGRLDLCKEQSPKKVYLEGNHELVLNSPDEDVVWIRCLGILYPNNKLKTTPPSSIVGVINPVLKKKILELNSSNKEKYESGA